MTGPVNISYTNTTIASKRVQKPRSRKDLPPVQALDIGYTARSWWRGERESRAAGSENECNRA